ncbi:MAG: hypothetical protein QXT00_08630 [Ignisphaera sp.]
MVNLVNMRLVIRCDRIQDLPFRFNKVKGEYCMVFRKKLRNDEFLAIILDIAEEYVIKGRVVKGY